MTVNFIYSNITNLPRGFTVWVKSKGQMVSFPTLIMNYFSCLFLSPWCETMWMMALQSLVPFLFMEKAFEMWWGKYPAYLSVMSIQTEINLHK